MDSYEVFHGRVSAAEVRSLFVGDPRSRDPGTGRFWEYQVRIVEGRCAPVAFVHHCCHQQLPARPRGYVIPLSLSETSLWDAWQCFHYSRVLGLPQQARPQGWDRTHLLRRRTEPLGRPPAPVGPSDPSYDRLGGGPVPLVTTARPPCPREFRGKRPGPAGMTRAAADGAPEGREVRAPRRQEPRPRGRAIRSRQGRGRGHGEKAHGVVGGFTHGWPPRKATTAITRLHVPQGDLAIPRSRREGPRCVRSIAG